MSDDGRQTLGFQSDVKQLLHLMVHSLYSHKEIFLRELISNAADACDKLRFETLSDASLFEDDPDLKIRVGFDADKRTVTITDNGIGMSRAEVIEHLGTIAKSGTAGFLQNLTGDQKKDAHLIGQFGVGFYSAFMVADRVEVHTRRAGMAAAEGVLWSSDGQGEFTVEAAERATRGTTVTLHLKEGEEEFADGMRLRHLVRKYSDHISVPVLMPRETDKEDEDATAGEEETVNTATALWTRPKSEISDEEYREFYKHVAHDFQDPLAWSHHKVEGKLEYTSLLYVPARAPFDLWQREGVRGLKLYVQRVFIMDEAEQFLPLYLRFVKGVVDSNDLSLNVSREILQKDPAVESMRKALTRRALDMLAALADDQEKYAAFWKEFGLVLKEGPAEDFENRERIAKLLRFASTHNDQPQQEQSLADYVGRMQAGQDKIYYVAADTFEQARTSPHLEIFRKKSVEVLLLSDRIDEWVMAALREYDGKALQDVSKGELDLGAIEGAEAKAEQEELEKTYNGLIGKVKAVLGEQVQDVRMTQRLTESPACLAVGEHDIGAPMRRMLEAAGQNVPESKPIFELNPNHPLVKRLNGDPESRRFEDLARILFDQARLADGGELADPGAYVQRLNRLLLELGA